MTVTGKTARTGWFVGTAIGWAILSPVVVRSLIAPLSGNITLVAAGAFPGLVNRSQPPNSSVVPVSLWFQWPLVALLAGVVVWLILRFAKAPSGVWLGVAAGVGLALLGSLFTVVQILAFVRSVPHADPWPWLIYHDLPFGVAAIAGAWLGDWAAAKSSRLSVQQAFRADAQKSS